MTPGIIEELKVLVLHPHNRCNCRCIMCDIWKTTDSQEISPVDLEQLRVQWVVFSGGEPLMHSDLFRLAALLKERNIRTTLLSTGLLIKRHAQAIVNHMDEAILSLDGPADIHDRIRRTPGAFEAMRVGVRELRRLRPGFFISVRTTVQRQNCRVLQATVAAAREGASFRRRGFGLWLDEIHRKRWTKHRNRNIRGFSAYETTVEEIRIYRGSHCSRGERSDCPA